MTTRMASLTSAVPGGTRLLLALVLCLAVLPSVDAMITSNTLRNSRLGNTYTYSVYSGATVTGEGFVTGTTTYPYVFDAAMNQFVVKLLNGYLAFKNVSLASVGGSLSTCMSTNGGTDTTGQRCYKALLAATAPSDCPAANVLCCPLFWRVGGQNIQTTMAQMDVETIFWNGAYVVNGLFANFSETYLTENSNCSRPLLSGTTELSLAVDATGEWRFVPLMTSYLLKETALSVNATVAAVHFNNTNPQDSINAARVAQRPFYRVIDKYLVPVVVCAALLFVIGLFLVLACGCGTMRAAARVRRTQRHLIDLKSAPPVRGSVAVLDNISPESSSRSSSEESRRSKRRSVVSRPGSRRSAKQSHSGSSSSNSDSDADESRSTPSPNRESVSSQSASRHGSSKSKGSSKSLKAKNSVASRKASSKKTKLADFPEPPAPLPGIRPRKASAQADDAPSQAASAHLSKRSSSTGTVVHRVAKPPHSGPSQKGWFNE